MVIFAREQETATTQKHMTITKRIRYVLRMYRTGRSRVDPAGKLDATRKAVRYRFPAPDIEQMLEEIGSSYTGRRPPSTRLLIPTDNKLGDESELFKALED